MSIEQAEVWLVTFYPTVGQEIGKTRPALVINDDRVGKLKLRTVVPITDWKDAYAHYPWMIQIAPHSDNGLSKVSVIDCFQVKNISIERFERRIGAVDAALLFKVHTTTLKTFNPLYKIAAREDF